MSCFIFHAEPSEHSDEWWRRIFVSCQYFFSFLIFSPHPVHLPLKLANFKWYVHILCILPLIIEGEPVHWRRASSTIHRKRGREGERDEQEMPGKWMKVRRRVYRSANSNRKLFHFNLLTGFSHKQFNVHLV